MHDPRSQKHHAVPVLQARKARAPVTFSIVFCLGQQRCAFQLKLLQASSSLQGPVGRLRLLPALMYAVARGNAGPSALSKSHPKADFSGFQGAPRMLGAFPKQAATLCFTVLIPESEIARFMRGDRIRKEVELNVTLSEIDWR